MRGETEREGERERDREGGRERGDEGGRVLKKRGREWRCGGREMEDVCL